MKTGEGIYLWIQVKASIYEGIYLWRQVKASIYEGRWRHLFMKAGEGICLWRQVKVSIYEGRWRHLFMLAGEGIYLWRQLCSNSASASHVRIRYSSSWSKYTVICSKLLQSICYAGIKDITIIYKYNVCMKYVWSLCVVCMSYVSNVYEDMYDVSILTSYISSYTFDT